MKKIVLLGIVFAFVGCTNSQTALTPAPKSVVKKAVQKQVIQKKTYPQWIDNPNIDGEDGVVGIVKLMKNKKKQEYIAKKLAIASYQEQKRINIDTTTKTNQSVSGNSYATSSSSQITRQTSNHFKTNTMVKKAEFSDKENYYIWMVVKK
jgi:hypothetical protein